MTIGIMLLSGCATKANLDYNEQFDFSTLKIFQISSSPEKSPVDSKFEGPLVEKRIVTAIEAELAQKGYVKADADADFRVTYQLGVKSEVTSNSSSVSFGFGRHSRGSSMGIAYGFPANGVQTYDRGILTIDVISIKTGDLIWRGSSSRRLYDGSTPEKSNQLVTEVVSTILEQFPPDSAE
ncbi:MAG: DUF4136 domain-containing protein [Gammaproteobacteria bacterium]|nr:DUF4136 domain-containing protein [Gammaproteobacteria bacterium]